MNELDPLRLAEKLGPIACELQYDPSGRWGAETVRPINDAAYMLRQQHKMILELTEALAKENDK